MYVYICVIYVCVSTLCFTGFTGAAALQQSQLPHVIRQWLVFGFPATLANVSVPKTHHLSYSVPLCNQKAYG